MKRGGHVKSKVVQSTRTMKRGGSGGIQILELLRCKIKQIILTEKI